jgi:uncharacterized protein with HEPN domain
MSDRNRFSILAILEAIEKIEEYTKGISNADEFYFHKVIFDACLMNFVVIGEMVLRLDESFKKNNKEIEWDKIKGFRNIVAHDYFGVDAEEVWQIIKQKMPDLKERLKALDDIWHL